MVFIDSSFVIALADEDDQFHERAMRLLPKLERTRTLTDLVISECVSAIGTRLGVKAGRETFENLMYDPSTQVLFSNRRLFERAEAIFLKFDGALSFADSVSVRVMYDQKITQVASFDSDFDRVERVEKIGT